MSLPPLLKLSSEAEYKQYFIDNYCNKCPVITFDGLPVMFYPDMFEHAFYKRAKPKWRAPKDCVDSDRCERLPWIKAVLEDRTIVPKQGYDKARHKYDNTRRIAFLAPNNYLVVIRNVGAKWRFVTAHLVDNQDTANKILSSPVWNK